MITTNMVHDRATPVLGGLPVAGAPPSGQFTSGYLATLLCSSLAVALVVELAPAYLVDAPLRAAFAMVTASSSSAP